MRYIGHAGRVSMLMWLLASCSPQEPVPERMLKQSPSIFPDYAGVTIPSNIAPLRFALEGKPEEAVAVISGRKGKVVVEAEEGAFLIPEKKWHNLLDASAGDSLQIKVYVRREGQWCMYDPFCWYVSPDGLDPYLVYRLIEPGYVLWNRMGIYQRDLTSFRQEAVLTNDKTQYNCMNCHSFNNREPERMVFHMRAKLGGTYLNGPDGVKRLEARINGKVQSLVYPSWHPSGRFVAFSMNQTKQAFHLNDRNRIEVYDLTSDVMVYDLEHDAVLTDSLVARAAAFETFPSFSADGKKLYFCSADARVLPQEFEDVKYSLCSIGFDAGSGRFGTQVDTLYNGRQEGKSVSFPRVSPDGRFLVFTLSSYGNFSIWHKDADLKMLDLSTGKVSGLEGVNSNDVESYHSWSSNGRWLVFSSRRADGLYTHPYLVHVDSDGRWGKPFAVPQADPWFYRNFMYSFNIPELVKGKVHLDSRALVRKALEANPRPETSGNADMTKH